MKLFLISSLFFSVVVVATSVLSHGIIIRNPLGSCGNVITALIVTIANWLLGIGITISTIIVLWAAFLFMTSGGSRDRVTQARQTLWYAIIGLAILLLANGVALLIENFLKGNY